MIGSRATGQRGDLAQLGERLLCTQEVSGSSPLFSNFAFYCLHVARNGYWLKLAKIEHSCGRSTKVSMAAIQAADVVSITITRSDT